MLINLKASMDTNFRKIMNPHLIKGLGSGSEPLITPGTGSKFSQLPDPAPQPHTNALRDAKVYTLHFFSVKFCGVTFFLRKILWCYIFSPENFVA